MTTNTDIQDFLNQGEEVLYVATKDESNLKSLFFSSFLPIFIVIVIIIAAPLLGKTIAIFPLLAISMISIPYFYTYNKYKNDYLKTNLFLTNHRLIILKDNTIIPINFEQIKYIYKPFSPRANVNCAKVDLYNDKKYKINFVDAEEIESKLIEIYPKYADNNNGDYVKTESKFAIMIVICFIIAFVLPYIYFVVLRR